MHAERVSRTANDEVSHLFFSYFVIYERPNANIIVLHLNAQDLRADRHFNCACIRYAQRVFEDSMHGLPPYRITFDALS